MSTLSPSWRPSSRPTVTPSFPPTNYVGHDDLFHTSRLSPAATCSVTIGSILGFVLISFFMYQIYFVFQENYGYSLLILSRKNQSTNMSIKEKIVNDQQYSYNPIHDHHAGSDVEHSHHDEDKIIVHSKAVCENMSSNDEIDIHLSCEDYKHIGMVNAPAR